MVSFVVTVYKMLSFPPHLFKIHYLKKSVTQPGVIVHVCNPSSLESRDWKDHSSSPAWAKSE
jgi:hypothetical protein